MDSSGFDRQAYAATSKEAPPPPRGGAGIFLVMMLALLGAGIYLFSKSGAFTSSAGSSTELAEIAKRLDQVDERLGQLEKGRRATPARAISEPLPVPAKTPPPNLVPASRRPSFVVSRPAQNVAPSSAATPVKAAVPSAPPPESADPAAREAWAATAERLGRAVGELGSQRKELRQTREDLNQVLTRFDRETLPFKLGNRSLSEPMGPLRLELRSTNSRRQTYSIRVHLEDTSIELKDRVLRERVEFYVSAFQEPVELVVSEIEKSHAAGYLFLPKQKAPR